MIVDMIYALLGSEPGSKWGPAKHNWAGIRGGAMAQFTRVLREFTAKVASDFERQFLSTQEPSTYFNLTPSKLGRCVRRVWYDARLDPEDVEEAIEPRSRINFWYGDALEAMIAALAQLSGAPVSVTDKPLQSLLLDDFEGRAYTDMRYRISDSVELPVEIKSMNSYAYESFEGKGFGGSMWGYDAQLQAYMRALDVETGISVAINKQTGHLAEFVEHRDDDRYLPDVFLRTTVAAMARREVPGDEPPTRQAASMRPLKQMPRTKCYEITDTRCKYCPRKRACHADLGEVEVAVLKGGPVFRIPIGTGLDTSTVSDSEGDPR